jgi:radical SAM protein with 4Fe4S-binding SPASM domain
VVTDGTLLTRRIVDTFAEKGVAVVLEFGPEDDPDGGERVALVLRGAPLHLRVVASGRCLDLAERVEALARRFPCATSIGVRWANLPAGHPDALGEKDLPAIRSALRALSRHSRRHLLSHGEAVLEEMEGTMAQLLERQVLFYSCGAGTRSLAVSPEGGLFPCFDLVGWEPLRVGDVFSGIDADRYRGWLRDLQVERRDPCRTCWARYLCGGGCRADAVFATGDAAVPNPVSCERIRQTYELAMALCLGVEEHEPGLLARRYLGSPTASPGIEVSDERPVLERYA